MTSISIEEAQSNLAALIASLKPGETIEIRQGEKPVASLTGRNRQVKSRREPGSAVGRLQVLVEDETHLDDFHEYMP